MELKIIILFLFKITSMYLSIKLVEIDDCITNINIKKYNNINNISLFENKQIKYCHPANFTYYPATIPYIIKNQIYEFGDIIYIDAYDKIPQGFINIIIQLDEYIIKTCQNNVFKCSNCKKINDNQYNCSKNIFNFYPNKRGIYYFFFQINSINELNLSEII